MTRLDQPAGGFGGPRIVKPQANIYTVLLLVAILLVAAALGIEVRRASQIKNPPPPPKVGMLDQAPSAAMAWTGPVGRLA